MKPAPRVYLDTNVFIAAFEMPGAAADHAWWLLTSVERGEIVGVTSELTLAELLVKPLRDDDQELAQTYQSIITDADNFHVDAVSRQRLTDAASLRARHDGLRLPDAIHVAAALGAGCRHIVSEDVRLPKSLDLAVHRLGPHLLDALLQDAAR